SMPVDPAADASVLKEIKQGPLPSIDRALSTMGVGGWLARLIEQSGSHTTPSTIIVSMIVAGAVGAFATATFVRIPFAPIGGGLLGLFAPVGLLRYKRKARMNRFEEQFPEALDLL